MKCLFTIILFLVLSEGYSQCTGIVKLVNAKKQRTNFYSPHYDTPLYSPLKYMRVDQAGNSEIYLSMRVLGDSARFDSADVDSSRLTMNTVFRQLAQRDSLQRAFPQKSIPAPANRVDAMAKTMDSMMTTLGMRSSLRDSLVRGMAQESKRPIPMIYRGSSITFSDGTKLAWPRQSAGFEVVGGVGTWGIFIHLTEPQLVQLTTGLISEISVYKYDQSLTKEQAEQVRQVLNCIQAAK